MNNEELTDAMVSQPGKILALEQDYIDLSRTYADHVREMGDIKAHIDADVASNKSLKNPEERKMAILSQCDAHERYQVLKKDIPEEDTNIKKLFAQIRYERDMLEVYLGLARMRAGGA